MRHPPFRERPPVCWIARLVNKHGLNDSVSLVRLRSGELVTANVLLCATTHFNEEHLYFSNKITTEDNAGLENTAFETETLGERKVDFKSRHANKAGDNVT